MSEPIYTKITEDKDPITRNAKLIFSQKFLSKLPYKETYSDLDLKTFGLPTVGNKDIDKQMHNELIDVALTINEMVEYFRRGVNFKITKHSDTKIIYDIISEYLISWNNKITNAINLSNPPLQDLEDLDKMAGVIYEHAKVHFRISAMSERFANSFGITPNKFLSRNSFNQKLIQQVIVDEKHRSLVDNITDKLTSDRINDGQAVTIKGTGETNNKWKPRWG